MYSIYTIVIQKWSSESAYTLRLQKAIKGQQLHLGHKDERNKWLKTDRLKLQPLYINITGKAKKPYKNLKSKNAGIAE